MCIVLDADVLSCVFSKDNAQHRQFAPVLKWITNGPGYAVYGGTEYLRQLQTARRYFGLMLELRRKGKARQVLTKAVDDEQVVVERLVSAACDDAHLIALFRASGCRLLCSNDGRADVYLKDKRYYRRGQSPPSIYRDLGHQHLLRPENIVELRNLA